MSSPSSATRSAPVDSVSDKAESTSASATVSSPKGSNSSSSFGSSLRTFLSIPTPALLVYLNVFLYALSFQIQQPSQLQLVKNLTKDTDSAQQYAFVRSVNGIAQLFGALFFGWLIDKVGVRSVFLISFAASAIMYGMISSADSVQMLFLAQIPAFFQHAVLPARSFVAKALPQKEQAQHFGYISAAYGVGAIIGPALGGLITAAMEGNLAFVSIIAVLGSILSLVIALISPLHQATTTTAATGSGATDVNVKAVEASEGNAGADGGSSSSANSTPEEKKEMTSSSAGAAGGEGSAGAAISEKKADDKDEKDWLASFARIFTTRKLLSVLFVKLFFSFSIALFHGVFQLVAQDRFGLDVQSVGYLMSFTGVMGMIAMLCQQLISSSIATLFFGAGAVVDQARVDRVIILVCALILSLSMYAFSLSFLSLHLFLIVVPVSIASTIFSQVNTGMISAASPQNLKGTLMAIDMSMFSGIRTVTPLLATYLFTTYGFFSIGVVAGSTMLLSVVYLAFFADVQAAKVKV